jgi:hypothetical protein
MRVYCYLDQKIHSYIKEEVDPTLCGAGENLRILTYCKNTVLSDPKTNAFTREHISFFVVITDLLILIIFVYFERSITYISIPKEEEHFKES